MICSDRLCEPLRGDDGCMASICNAGAFDALDFIWTRAWDDCPLAGMEEAASTAARHEEDQWYEWAETLAC